MQNEKITTAAWRQGMIHTCHKALCMPVDASHRNIMMELIPLAPWTHLMTPFGEAVCRASGWRYHVTFARGPLEGNDEVLWREFANSWRNRIVHFDVIRIVGARADLIYGNCPLFADHRLHGITQIEHYFGESRWLPCLHISM